MLKAELEKRYRALQLDYDELKERYGSLLAIQSEKGEDSHSSVGEGYVDAVQHQKVVERANIILGEIEAEYASNKHLGSLLLRIKNKLGINML